MSQINLNIVESHVRDAGVFCLLESTGGNCATIFAGATRDDPDYGVRYAAVAGPGQWITPSEAVADTEEFYVGLDDSGDGDTPPVNIEEVGATTEREVAALIIAQARKATVLTVDEARAAVVGPRHASPQAWRRLREALGPGEAHDIAVDIAGVAGGDPAEIERALTTVDWSSRWQA